MGFGQFAAASQFYLYGKRHCTLTGYERARRSWGADTSQDPALSLSGKVVVVTGANSGVGKEVARCAALQGARTYLVCRNAGRAEAARAELAAEAAARGNDNGGGGGDVRVLQCDVSLGREVRRAAAELAAAEPRIDCVVCNAGVMASELELTEEGVETTFATHLLNGTYLLVDLLLPQLRATEGSRVVVVSSGGMYNSKFPDWGVATGADCPDGFDGQMAYVYAKRGQVLLCEHWAQRHPAVRFVSAHPGWADTPAVDAAYGAKKSYLEPLRSARQGADGIAWLAAAPAEQLVSGSFYLDRAEQPKHMAGAFFSGGSWTKNTPAEVAAMVRGLAALADGRGGDAARLQRDGTGELRPMPQPLSLPRLMGRWYVVRTVPTFLERGARNSVEEYTWDADAEEIRVRFTYTDAAGANKELLQKAKVVDKVNNTRWSLRPKVGVYLPVQLPYIIIDADVEDYSYLTVGYPDRSYLWVMARTPDPEPEALAKQLRRVEECGYDLSQLEAVDHSPQGRGWEGC